MTTLSTIAADSWSISIGGGWIVLMLIGMGLCFVFMLAGMWLMRDGHGWAMCGRRWQQETPRTDVLTGAIPLDEHQQRRDSLTGAAAPHTDQDATVLVEGRSQR